jgi:hypothetical protein
MLPVRNHLPQARDRRKGDRQSCHPDVYCQVVDPLSESAAVAGPWNVSSGGVCVLVEPHYPPGTRLEVQLRGSGSRGSVNVFAEVVHTLLVPSFQEMWLTGCSFQGEGLAEEQLHFCI